MSGSKTHTNEQQDVTNPERLLIGASRPMRDLYKEILVVAGADITALITGESGAGKELVAREIHRRSGRAGGPFISINCSQLTESLLESRLFGHLKGAFTGAVASQKGLFEAASGGSILLDEVGDMPLNLQGSLLRVLQERTILPVGAHAERSVNVRVIAATNKDLDKEIKEGRFREDLYYRLNGFPIRVPALRERPSDIPLLVRQFLGTMEIEDGALELLCAYHWPGNVRELKAIIERLTLCAAAEGARMITADQARRVIKLKEEVMVADATAGRDSPEGRDTIMYANESRGGDFFEKRLNLEKLGFYEELVRSSGGRAQAAELMGVTYSTLYHRMERLQRRVESD
jgi:transcriptional regulator with GAF, ATPase, and Fis domain